MPELTAANLVAVALLVSLTAYLVMAGADFGGGVWDLFATGPRRRAQRALIAEAILPIWEANHVWLILAVVLVFVCFPSAFARMSVTLHIPLTLMLVGIVLRGSAFTFRKYDSQQDNVQRRWGLVFSWASLVTPVLLGVVAGTIAAGDVAARPSGTFVQAFVDPWLQPFPFAIGALSLALCAYLAAVYLTVETKDAGLQDDFRLRAFVAGFGVFLAAIASLALARSEAPYIWEGLTRSRWAPWYQVGVGLLGLVTLGALWRRHYRLARVAAPLQAALILWGWALCQYPYLLPFDLTIADAAAPRVTLVLVLWGLAAGFVVVVPSLVYLFRVFKSRPEAGAG
jgi:cytochrome d ubiquinol oxidase subunit II